MIKNVLAITTMVFALGACSSSSDSNPDTTPDDGGDLPPATNTKAGAYIGDFGSGEGVYVISNADNLSGLAIATDGSANSLFGNLGTGNSFDGVLNGYAHSASVDAAPGNFGPGPSGPTATPTSLSFDLNIVNGQTIESLSGTAVSLVGAGDGSLSPATPATVSGSWSGDHSFCCVDGGTDILRTEITFSGSDVSGRTVIVKPDGSEGTFSPAISGSITEFGDVSLLEFQWNESSYSGVIFFRPGTTDELVFVGEATGDASNLTIGSLLTR